MLRLLLPILCAATLVAGCSPPAFVTSPIYEPTGIHPDEQLPGVWMAAVPEGKGDQLNVFTLIIRKIADDRIQVVVNGDGTAADEAGFEKFTLWGVWTAHVSAVDGRLYYSGQMIDAGAHNRKTGEVGESQEAGDIRPGTGPVWLLARVEFTGEGHLVLHVMREEELIKRGLVPLRDEDGPADSAGVFDVTSDQLVELIRTAKPEEIFTGRFGPFIRVSGEMPAGFKADF